MFNFIFFIMKQNYFFKFVIVMIAALFIGNYATAQTCGNPPTNVISFFMTSTQGGGSGFLNGATVTFPTVPNDDPKGIYLNMSGSFSGNYVQINNGGGDGKNIQGQISGSTCVWLIGNSLAAGGRVILESWNSSNNLIDFQVNLNDYSWYPYYYIVTSGNKGDIKLLISKVQQPHLSPAQNQNDGPKLVNLTELLTPVIGENGNESLPFMYQATAAWGDFNNDGNLDLFMMGMYEKYFEFEDGVPIQNIDEDGNPIPLPDGEITSSSWQAIKCTRLYKNNGDGTFTRVSHPFPHTNRGAVAWLDYDNDGNLDIIIFGLTGNGRFTGIYRNQGSAGNYEFVEELPGEFEYLEGDSDDRSTRMIAVADYNNDGWVDVALTGRSEDSGRRVSLYMNLEGQGFQKMDYLVNGQPFIQHNGGTIAWADYNKDGYLDLLTFGYLQDGQDGLYPDYDFTHGGSMFLYKNNGDGTFANPIQIPAGEDGEIAWGDFNNDGYTDFVFGNFSWWPEPNNGWQSYIYMNKGDGTFEQFYNNQVGINGDQGISVSLGDVNNDGYEDIIQNKANPSAIFLNNAGVFPFVRQNLLFYEEGATRNDRSGVVTLVDFDNDKDLDLFANGYDDTKGQSHLWRNDLDELEGIPVNQAPSAPANLKATIDGEGATVFTWDASTDDLTPQIALRYNLYVKQGDIVKSVLPADLETGRLKVNETLAPIMGTAYKMSGLEGEFEWGVQAIDNAKNTSKFTKAGLVGIPKLNKTPVNVIGKKQAIELKAADALRGAVNVYSISGVNLYSKAGQINGTTVELPAGIYVVKVASAEGISVCKVVVK